MKQKRITNKPIRTRHVENKQKEEKKLQKGEKERKNKRKYTLQLYLQWHEEVENKKYNHNQPSSQSENQYRSETEYCCIRNLTT